MNAPDPSSSESRRTPTLTVLLFRDQLSARTFRIPLRWIHLLGISLGLCLVITLLSTGLAIRYARIAQRSGGARVIELERQVADLQVQLGALQPSVSFPTALGPAETPVQPIPSVVPSASPLAAASPTTKVSSLPSPPVVVAATPLPSPIASSAPRPVTLTKVDSMVELLPARIKPIAPDAEAAIELIQTKAIWSGSSLQVQYALQYIRGDGGSQQGRIIVLARGPQAMATHPANATNPRAGEARLLPEKGEFFSVSRFRAGRAEFTGIASHEAVQSVEIFVFSKGDELIARKSIQIGASDE